MKTKHLLFLSLAVILSTLYSCDASKRTFIHGYHAKKTVHKASHYERDAEKQVVEINDTEKEMLNRDKEALLASSTTETPLVKTESQENSVEMDIQNSAFVKENTKTTKKSQKALSNINKTIEKKAIPLKNVLKQQIEREKEEVGGKRVLPTSIMGLVFGGVSLLLSSWGMMFALFAEAGGMWVFLLVSGILLAIAGLVLSILSLIKTIKNKEKFRGRGIAIAGLAISAVALLILFVMSIIGMVMFF